MIDWDYTDTTYLKNLFWIETAAVRCIICFLGCCLKTCQQKIKFLQILIKSGFEDGLTGTIYGAKFIENIRYYLLSFFLSQQSKVFLLHRIHQDLSSDKGSSEFHGVQHFDKRVFLRSRNSTMHQWISKKWALSNSFDIVKSCQNWSI